MLSSLQILFAYGGLLYDCGLRARWSVMRNSKLMSAKVEVTILLALPQFKWSVRVNQLNGTR
ncbi:MAG: hypothetical protein DMG76_18570 [Acidobacteria bacterium]|nr:MAG: hypothetical protein DMG76_18570 [Acidobacteriota bacterium]